MITLLTLFACANPIIEGEVLDHLGAPVVAAKVELVGTTHSALTDELGQYTIPYVPGANTLRVSKDGHLAVERGYELAENATLPASAIHLYPTDGPSALTALTEDGAVALPMVSLDAAQGSRQLGLERAPDPALPSQIWGFLYQPDVSLVDEEQAAERLIELLLLGKGREGGVALHAAEWRAAETFDTYRGQQARPVNRWVPHRSLTLTDAPIDELTDSTARVLRPDASFDDGVYTLRLRGEVRAGWAFSVGDLDTLRDQEEYHGH